MRPRWSAGQRAAAWGAVLVSALVPWWLMSREPAAPGGVTAVRALPAARSTGADVPGLPLPEAAAPAQPRPAATLAPADAPNEEAPYRFVGQWTQGRHAAVVLQSGGGSVVVQVPGPVDARFDALAVDERQLVLRDRRLGREIRLPLAVPDAKHAGPAARALGQAPAEVWNPSSETDSEN